MMVLNGRLRYTFSPVILMSLLCLSSCVSTTGTKIAHTRDSLSQTEKLGVLVKKEKDFSVLLSRDKGTSVGVLFGLIGVAVEAGIRADTDHQYEALLKPRVMGYDLEARMAYALLKSLRSAKVFKIVEGVNADDPAVLKQEGFDSVLVVTVNEWGLRLCLSSVSAEQLQAGIEVHATLMQKGSLIWERNEYYLDGRCYPTEELRGQDKLLEQALTRAVDNVSGKLINEVCFP
jgi:hypothetical protein